MPASDWFTGSGRAVEHEGGGEKVAEKHAKPCYHWQFLVLV
jgi:hypothetical protein